MTSRRFATILALSFVAGFVLRVALATVFVGLGAAPKFSAAPDQLEYEFYAYQLSQGRGYCHSSGEPTIYRAPGTSLSLMPVYVLCGRNFAAGRLWFCFLSATTCVAAGWLGLITFGRTVGAVTALGLAVYPNHAYYCLHFVSEVPFGLATVLAVGLSIKAWHGGSRLWSPLAGIAWGAACLIRPNILLAPALMALLIFVLPRVHWLSRFRRMAVMGVATLCIVSPWVIRNGLVSGNWTVSTVGSWTFQGAHNEQVLRESPGSWVVDRNLPFQLSHNETKDAQAAWQAGRSFVKQHWRQMPYLVAMKLYRLLTPFESTPNRMVFWTFTVSWLMMFPLVAMGLVKAMRINKTDALLLMSPLAAIVLTAVIFYGSARFRDSVSPIYLVFAAVSIVSLLRPSSISQLPHGAP
ncbi:MAG: glycosyltransferase family 39 protein [Planctomycetes bacterium]|nr:glycosyltransferase family 39 protein [Planctomycetota bacterium]